MTCIKPSTASQGSPTITKAPSSSHLVSDAPVTIIGKRSHCRPHITSQTDELNELLEEALSTA